MEFLEKYMKENQAEASQKTMEDVLDWCRSIERDKPGRGITEFHDIVQDNFKDQPEAMVTMIRSIIEYDRPYELNVIGK